MLEHYFQRGDDDERTTLSQRKQSLSCRARRVAQRGASTRRQGKVRGKTPPQAPARRAVERGLHLPMGQRWEGRQAGKVLRAVWGQEDPAGLFIHVRSELGQALSFLYLAGRWVRSHLVSGRAKRRVRRNRQG